ncbi:unnamed protein product [Ectocarpus sp. 4 AP-2014]
MITQCCTREPVHTPFRCHAPIKDSASFGFPSTTQTWATQLSEKKKKRLSFRSEAVGLPSTWYLVVNTVDVKCRRYRRRQDSPERRRLREPQWDSLPGTLS